MDRALFEELARCRDCDSKPRVHPSCRCEECATAASSARAGALARAVRYGVSIYSENVKPLRVYARDGYLCEICGLPVIPTLSPPSPLAPVLDHRIPVAFGGEHTYDNLRCTHHYCNAKKSSQMCDPDTRARIIQLIDSRYLARFGTHALGAEDYSDGWLRGLFGDEALSEIEGPAEEPQLALSHGDDEQSEHDEPVFVTDAEAMCQLAITPDVFDRLVADGYLDCFRGEEGWLIPLRDISAAREALEAGLPADDETPSEDAVEGGLIWWLERDHSLQRFPEHVLDVCGEAGLPPEPEAGDVWVSPREAAYLLGCSVNEARTHAKSGAIKSIQHAGYWLLSARAVEAYHDANV